MGSGSSVAAGGAAPPAAELAARIGGLGPEFAELQRRVAEGEVNRDVLLEHMAKRKVDLQRVAEGQVDRDVLLAIQRDLLDLPSQSGAGQAAAPLAQSQTGGAPVRSGTGSASVVAAAQPALDALLAKAAELAAWPAAHADGLEVARSDTGVPPKTGENKLVVHVPGLPPVDVPAVEKRLADAAEAARQWEEFLRDGGTVPKLAGKTYPEPIKWWEVDLKWAAKPEAIVGGLLFSKDKKVATHLLLGPPTKAGKVPLQKLPALAQLTKHPLQQLGAADKGAAGGWSAPLADAGKMLMGVPGQAIAKWVQKVEKQADEALGCAADMLKEAASHKEKRDEEERERKEKEEKEKREKQEREERSKKYDEQKVVYNAWECLAKERYGPLVIELWAAVVGFSLPRTQEVIAALEKVGLPPGTKFFHRDWKAGVGFNEEKMSLHRADAGKLSGGWEEEGKGGMSAEGQEYGWATATELLEAAQPPHKRGDLHKWLQEHCGSAERPRKKVQPDLLACGPSADPPTGQDIAKLTADALGIELPPAPPLPKY